ncbi:hypothetical protein [uncultured Actinobacillus sp.]
MFSTFYTWSMQKETEIRHGRHCVFNFVGSCGGAPISIIRQYIEQQQTPD